MSGARELLREQLRRVPAFRALVRTIEGRLLAEGEPLAAPLLDLGCGDGTFAELCLSEPAAVGVDVDLAALVEARRGGAYRALVCAAASALPLRGCVFAGVLANCSLEHMPSPDAVIGEVRRTLQPAGRFVFGVPNHAFAELLLAPTVLRALGLPHLARAYGDWFNRHSVHLTVERAEAWRARLERGGFTIERQRSYVSPAAHRAFDLCHYLALPRLLVRTLTGRWLLRRNALSNRLYERWLGRYVEEGEPAVGAYAWFECRRG